MPDTVRGYVWRGGVTGTLEGSLGVISIPLGEGLEVATRQACAEVFEGCSLHSSPPAPGQFDVVIEPQVVRYSFTWGRIDFGPSNRGVAASVGVRFKHSVADRAVSDKVYSGNHVSEPAGPIAPQRIAAEGALASAVAAGFGELWLNPDLQRMIFEAAARRRPPGGPALASRPNDGPRSSLAGELADLQFRKVPERPDDVAVIIGNARYSALGRDIPDVLPAHADADAMRRYAREALGIRDDNILFFKDATLTDLISTFGTEGNPRGQLHNWVKPGRSHVFVYYSGHGAPSGKDGSSYLVPVDAQASLLELNGYSLRTLYGNLARIPAKSITVVLEACFSGGSQAGSVIGRASPIFSNAADTPVPPTLTVVTAGAANQIASWERDGSNGLFTKYFLRGMSGEADEAPHGDRNGEVKLDELRSYLKDTLSYYALRYYGREQTAHITTSRSQ